MHIDKNMCDGIIGTLLNILGKTKDNVKFRMDFAEIGLRKQLAPEKRGQNTFYFQHVILYLERRR